MKRINVVGRTKDSNSGARNVEEAKEDVKNVLKVRDAVIILLTGVSEAHDKK